MPGTEGSGNTPGAAAHPGRLDYGAELNSQQLAAVTSPGGAALVIAGAGSGKTRTLTYRVAWLLEQGVRPWEILLLTFTNKAAREMLARVAELVGAGSEGIWGGTFHSIGNRILRRHADLLGYQPNFTILDREDQCDLLKKAAQAAGAPVRDKQFPKPEVLAELFSLAVNTNRPLAAVVRDRFTYFDELLDPLTRVHRAYEQRKREANSLDFDDLLVRTLELLATQEEVGARYRQQFTHVLVDEYQDTNHIQAELIHVLAGHHGNVMVVGDDAQSIYSWRGADFENILGFPRRYPGAATFRIETNYRSTPEILELANAAIRHNERQFEKNLRAWRDSGIRPLVAALDSNNEQAAYVAGEIERLHRGGLGYDEMAVLYRAHFHSMELQLELTRRGIPFELTSGVRFFEQAHVKDATSFLKFAVNPRDETAFRRLVRLLPGIGEKGADTLWQAVQGAGAGGLRAVKATPRMEKSWRQVVDTLLEIAPPGGPILAPDRALECVLEALYDDYMQAEFANYETRREDLRTLAGFARQFASTADFLAQLALLTNVDGEVSRQQETGPRVSLTSVHQAKGLEWRAVFVIWLTEGMFPGGRAIESGGTALEEERRLFYVAVTRGRDRLFLTWPKYRLNSNYGDPYQRRSRFLAEIPPHLVESAREAPAPVRRSPAAPSKKSGADWWY